MLSSAAPGLQPNSRLCGGIYPLLSSEPKVAERRAKRRAKTVNKMILMIILFKLYCK